MRATLSFKLPDEQDEFASAVNGSKLEVAVQDFDNALRSIHKHEAITEEMLSELEIENLTEEQKALICNLAFYFRQLLGKYIRDEL